MSGEQLTDWNFEGWSNEQLAQEVKKLSVGSGELSRQFASASDVLRDLASSLHGVDAVLRDQLNKLGIDWGGAAGEKSQQKTKVTSEGFNEAGEATVGNSDAMARQGESTTDARNKSPESDSLRGDTDKNLFDKGAGLFGIETDHAAEVAQTNRAREQAIDSLTGYTKNSQGALDSFRTPNQPPDIVVASAAVAPTVGPAVTPGTGGTPGIHGGPGFTGTPGPGSPGSPLGPTPNLPGGSTGVIPGTQPPGPLATGPGLPKPFGSPLPVGIAAATAAATGLAGATGAARGPQVVGGGRGPSQAPKTPIAPTGPKGAPSTIGAGDKPGAGGKGGPGVPGATGAAGKGAMTPGGATGVGPDANRPGAGAAGKGGVAGKGSGSLMSPAASAAKGEGDEDGEHFSKYGVDSDEMFGDDRMVVQSVIGEDPKDK
ncbi:hypothetical protein ACIA8G_23720 [Lentzea sp. NPDC051213]|uniref:hypothetical protein n=1 Tax=Lentzea sp. NPDC051213 TaxID=3364126 RepID=UPI00378E1C0E